MSDLSAYIDWIDNQGWSQEKKLDAFAVLARREDALLYPLTGSAWASWSNNYDDGDRVSREGWRPSDRTWDLLPAWARDILDPGGSDE